MMLLLNRNNFSEEHNRSHFFEGKTSIPNILEIRDPFQSDLKIIELKESENKGYLRDGVYTNIDPVEESLLNEFDITGILMGENRRAIAKTKDGKTFIIKEGMNLGTNNGIVKAILPGGVVIVEKIVNVYGEDEYIETIIPLTNKIKKSTNTNNSQINNQINYQMMPK